MPQPGGMTHVEVASDIIQSHKDTLTEVKKVACYYDS